MAIDEQSLLACGRPIDQVWEHIEEPPDAHEATCPDCRQARRSLARLDEATSSLRLEDEADPALVPPPIVKASIMELARAEVRRGARLPLRPPVQVDRPPELTISEQAVAGVVRGAADRLAGLHARRCKVALDRTSLIDPTMVAGEPSIRVRIELGIAISAAHAVQQITEQLRSTVRAAVLADTGMTADKIDISVEDLFDV